MGHRGIFIAVIQQLGLVLLTCRQVISQFVD